MAYHPGRRKAAADAGRAVHYRTEKTGGAPFTGGGEAVWSIARRSDVPETGRPLMRECSGV
jgi:hypothetical protein